MKIYIDHQLIKKVQANEITEEILIHGEVRFTWTSLFEYLGLNSIFKNYPEFKQDPFFNMFISAIEDRESPEVLMDLFDQLFALSLTEIKGMKEIDSTFLLDQMHNQPSNTLFSASLSNYKKILSDDPYHTIHNLTLYLAFDRMCVALSAIFEQPKLINSQGLKVLKDCLIESFQHITAQGRAAPSFFRLIETLYAYEMRDENLDNYTDADWLTLCQSSLSLRPREELIDVEYIDQAINDESIIVLTSDSEEKVRLSLSLANYMIKSHDLNYTLSPTKVIHV